MNLKHLQLVVFSLSLCILSSSCKKETLNTSPLKRGESSGLTAEQRKTKIGSLSSKIFTKAKSIRKVDELSRYLVEKVAAARKNKNVVAPSKCSPTALARLIDKYLLEFGPLEFAVYGDYVAVNQLAAIIDITPQYYGTKGQYTSTVEKYRKGLESFWKMYNQIRINGQHNETLDDREKIAIVYILFGGATPEEAYSIADAFIAINEESPVFIETPLLSYEGFSIYHLIVIGDGLIQVLSELGLNSDVVIGGVLSHEWGHQVQIDHSQSWFMFGGPGEWPFTPEFSRFIETEADYFSGYYLTHRKGGSYSWRKIAQFLYLFYSTGDCSFDDPNHHGTPNQRLAASRLGFLIAELTFPQTKVLSADQLHLFYTVSYDFLIVGNLSGRQAESRLQTKELKGMFKKILKHKSEIQAIASGKLSKTAIENLP